MKSKLSLFYEKILGFGLPVAIFLVAISFYLKTYDSCQIKITMFHVFGTVIVMVWLMKVLEDGCLPAGKTSLLVVLPVLAFLLSGIVSHVFFSPFQATSWEELIRRMIFTGMFLVIYFEYRDFVKVKRLLLWVIIAGVISALYGFVQYFGMDPFIWKGAFGNRIFSTFGNPNFYSAYLVLVVPLVLASIDLSDLKETKNAVSAMTWMSFLGLFYCFTQFIQKGTYLKLGGLGSLLHSFFVGNNMVAFIIITLAGIALLFHLKIKSKTPMLVYYLILINIILSRSKASYIGVAAAVCSFAIFAAFYVSPIDKKTRKKFLVIFVSVIVIFTSIGVAYLISKRIDSLRFRIFTWHSTKTLIDEHPVRGSGIGTFKITYPRVRREEIFHIEGKHNTETDHPENEHMEIVYDEGIIGYGVFVWMLLTMFVIASRKLKCDTDKSDSGHRYLVGLMAGIVGMLTHNLMCVNMRFVSSGFTFWITLGLMASYFSNVYSGPNRDYIKVPFPGFARKLLQLALAALLAFVFIPYFLRLYKADIFHNVSIAYSKASQWDNALKNYNNVIANNPHYIMTHYFMGNVYNDRWNRSSDGKLLKTYNPEWGDRDFVPRDDSERALAKYDEVKHLAPNYVQVHFQVGNVYQKLNRWDEAIESYEKALALDPVFAPTYFKMGWCYVQKKEWKEAEDVYKKAVFWNPNFVQSYINLANVYYMQNKYAEALGVYRKALELKPGDGRLKDIVNKLNQALAAQKKD